MNRKERIKQHFQKYKMYYAVAGTAVTVAGITTLIMRDYYSDSSISSSVTGAASPSVTVTGKKNLVLNTVSYISAERQGPPSWVVRCLETGNVFTSQRAAAIEMGIAQSNISKHLNGLQDHAEGYHFERLVMAA